MLSLGQLINQNVHNHGGWEPGASSEGVEIHSVCHLDGYLIVNSVALGVDDAGAKYFVVDDLPSNQADAGLSVRVPHDGRKIAGESVIARALSRVSPGARLNSPTCCHARQ